VDGRTAAAHLLADFDGAVLHRARDHMWGKLAATRHNFVGLESGRDDILSEGRQKRMRDKLNKGRMRVIQTDGVHTPWRQHQRAGGDGSCPRCGHACGDWEHLAWDCPARAAEMNEDESDLAARRRRDGGAPRCLWTLGQVPRGWCPSVVSTAMRSDAGWATGQYDPGKEAQWAGTDGSCIRTAAGPRAGAGVAFAATPHMDAGLPVPGTIQTAQRGEVAAVAYALTVADRPLRIVSDSSYVVERLRLAREGRAFDVKETHPDLWHIIGEHLHKLRGVRWIRSHQTQQEACQEGWSTLDWTLNDRADRLAGTGANSHGDSTEDLRRFAAGKMLAWRIQNFLHRAHDRLEKLRLTKGREAGGGFWCGEMREGERGATRRMDWPRPRGATTWRDAERMMSATAAAVPRDTVPGDRCSSSNGGATASQGFVLGRIWPPATPPDGTKGVGGVQIADWMRLA
jgi:ribonuclease HI